MCSIMRKRISTMISLLFILLLSYTYAGAIDLTQDKYVKVYEDMTKAVYLNKESPVVTRYSPPYYIIQGECIIDDFSSNRIYTHISNYFYNYDQQEIATNNTFTTIYYKDGSSETFPVPPDYPLNPVIPLPKDSVGSIIGHMYFYLCYDIPFYKDL